MTHKLSGTEKAGLQAQAERGHVNCGFHSTLLVVYFWPKLVSMAACLIRDSLSTALLHIVAFLFILDCLM